MFLFIKLFDKNCTLVYNKLRKRRKRRSDARA